MRALLIVPGQPARQVSGSSIRYTERDRISPLAQERLDEAFSLGVLSSAGLQFVLTLKRA
jgi:hypothetical protein